jgi:putative two-component system hydrogenase maturation factor HypX/HoxX
MGARGAAELRLVDAVFGDSAGRLLASVHARAAALAASPDLAELLRAKERERRCDEAAKPLGAYRDEELAAMRRNFYGFDPSYHIARSNFVRRVAPSRTPLHLAIHRQGGREPVPRVVT